MDKACRWCKNYDIKGYCYNFEAEEVDLDVILENSDVEIGLEEANLPEDLLNKLQEYFTKKCFKENFDTMREIILEFMKMEVADNIVSSLEQGKEYINTKVEIKNPDSFFCSNWE